MGFATFFMSMAAARAEPTPPTALADAIISLVAGEECMLGEKPVSCFKKAQALLSKIDVDVNSKGKTPDGDEVSPLLASLVAVGNGREGGIELVRFLLEEDDLDVNAGAVWSDGSKTTPLFAALDTAADGKEGSLELARSLLERKDVDVNALGVSPDGTQVPHLSDAPPPRSKLLRRARCRLCGRRCPPCTTPSGSGWTTAWSSRARSSAARTST